MYLSGVLESIINLKIEIKVCDSMETDVYLLKLLEKQLRYSLIHRPVIQEA